MNGKKLERPLHLDMAFGEAMARYAQTKPEEVEPPAGKKRKGTRPESSAPTGVTAAAGSAAGVAEDAADEAVP
jgi:hypothetical protein